ncbi:MAG: type II secretion system secretin GspD [Parvularculaceae bacterium]|nr:type II secretion system secretin GspD [Parvularculaceae bacterium]
MRFFNRLIACVAVAAAATSSVTAQEGREICGAELNYDGVDLRAVVDEIAVRTGRTFILDSRVQGQVTIKSPPNGGICADEAWELFQAALRVNGFVATPVGGKKYKIVGLQDAQRSGGPVGPGRIGDPVTEIVRLRYVDAREAAANLSQIIGQNGVAAAVRGGNSIILVDTAENVTRLKQVIAEIDRDPTVYRTIPLDNASATEVARVVSSLARQIQEEGGQAPSPVSIVPMEASNSILIRAEPSMINRLSAVVSELDRYGEEQADLSVIPLNHADAEDLAPLLRELAGAQQAGASGSAEAAAAAGANVIVPPSGGRQRAVISFHKQTNSIIISGDADIQNTLREVIGQLDKRRAQVLIEAIIVEISDTTAQELGVQYFIGNTEGKRIPFSGTDFPGAPPEIFSAIGEQILDGADTTDGKKLLRDAALRSLLGVSGFGLGLGGSTKDGTIFGAMLTAIKEDDTSNVLSTPSVVTLDNEEAKLSVGQEIPITTGEAVGDNFQNAFRTVSREQVGTILEVTPQINEGGTVTLKIRQESSSIDGPVISDSTDLITNKREITTSTVVDDGAIHVLGGLIDETRSTREDKVPVVGDLPVAGSLFKTRAKQKSRRNLMVFIRPTILRDKESAARATSRKLDYVRGQELLQTGRPDSALDRLIEEATGLAPPPDAAGPDANENE